MAMGRALMKLQEHAPAQLSAWPAGFLPMGPVMCLGLESRPAQTLWDGVVTLRKLRIWCCLLPLAVLCPAAARADLPDVVAAARASVVAVGLYSALSSPRFGFRGTGFVVGDGQTLVTNAHVLPENPADPALVMQIGINRPGSGQEPEIRVLRLVSLDRAHDLAVLRFSGSALPTMTLAAAGSAREGQSVAFIGFPVGGLLGFSPVTHRGIIASIAPILLPPPTSRQLSAAAVAQLRDGAFDIYQLDATAYPGNSGGPVFDSESGQVVGVLNMVLVKGSRESVLTNPTGIAYAIPVRHVHVVLARP